MEYQLLHLSYKNRPEHAVIYLTLYSIIKLLCLTRTLYIVDTCDCTQWG